MLNICSLVTTKMQIQTDQRKNVLRASPHPWEAPPCEPTNLFNGRKPMSLLLESSDLEKYLPKVNTQKLTRSQEDSFGPRGQAIPRPDSRTWQCCPCGTTFFEGKDTGLRVHGES